MKMDTPQSETDAGRWSLDPAKMLRSPRGFTMVELMISVVLLGLVSGVIWSLFSSTSSAMQEADSLADTLDRSRFALEQVAADVRSAGAYGSPDSDEDPWALPRPNQRRIVGLASYNGWQDQTPYPADVAAEHTDSSGATAIGFDGFIVMGALDYSTTFELRDMQFTGGGAGSGVPGFAIGGRIPLGAVDSPGRFAERGLKKLLINDPFYTETGLFGESPTDFNRSSPMIDSVYNDIGSRMIRVMDRQGYIQFGAISEDDPTWQNGISFGFVQPGLQTKVAGRPFGLQPQSAEDQDVGYEAALIDAYWYHVEEDPENAGNYQLVRDRLDADALSTALASGWSSLSETTLLQNGPLPESNSGSSQRQRTVVVDRLVDFQFWVDCADAGGNLTNVSWESNWVTPSGGTDPAHDCLDPTAPAPGRARVAHIRMSVRTEDERRELGHSAFLDAEGAYDPSVPLQTYDMEPDSPGATRVVTVQSDVELTNFSYKNLTR